MSTTSSSAATRSSAFGERPFPDPLFTLTLTRLHSRFRPPTLAPTSSYYFAVVECDSVATADAIYTQCDGLEYEGSANVLDLRFIPDDMSYDDEQPREVATVVPTGYKPVLFETKVTVAPLSRAALPRPRLMLLCVPLCAPRTVRRRCSTPRST